MAALLNVNIFPDDRQGEYQLDIASSGHLTSLLFLSTKDFAWS